MSILDTRAREFPVLAARPRLAGAGLFLLVALTTLAVGLLIVYGRSLIAVGGFVLGVLYLVILSHWQRGIYALLVYLPFAGVVALALYPWEDLPILNPVLYKDWLFVLPAYIGFLAALLLRRERLPGLPRTPCVLLLALSLLVLAQMANPGVPNALVALIGAKVWLFYLPLYVLSFALVTSRRDVIFLLRLLTVLATIPCVVGIAEYVLAQFLDYRAVMQTIYGAAAVRATQEFTTREVGAGFIERIPSTFTFVAQYFSFTLAMMVPCYAVWRTDPSASWRRLGKWILVVVIAASLLSGSRAAFVLVPFLLVLMYGLDRGFSGVLRACIYLGGVVLAALAISRSTVVALYEHVSELFSLYAHQTAYGGLVQAILTAPLGNGTGTNTGPARYAFEKPELFSPIENYYAKAVHELGIPGLLLTWGLLAALIWQGLKKRRLKDRGLRACSAVLVAFLITVAVYSFKGWFIDLDPLNVYFWVFAGVLAKLPYLQAAEAATGDVSNPREAQPWP